MILKCNYLAQGLVTGAMWGNVVHIQHCNLEKLRIFRSFLSYVHDNIALGGGIL